MKFSHLFKIKRTRADRWFDPVLSIDTRLFFDPFLVYAQEEGCFVGSHAEIISFFNSAFKLIAQARGQPSSQRYEKAVCDLMLPEVEELCLGYTEAGTRGSGSGRDLANAIAAAIWEAIKHGMTEIRHFEEIGILREGIGADRISDATAGVLRRRLAAYTQEICRRHGVPTKTVRYQRGAYDPAREVWIPIQARLPTNPYNGKAVLLAPRKYLRHLPTINASDFWEYCYNNENDTIRNEFNYDVARHVSKGEIIRLARKHPEIRRAYLDSIETQGPQPYDFSKDPKGLLDWYDATFQYCRGHRLRLAVDSENGFLAVVDRMVKQFRVFVEENSGWRLLWNDNQTSRPETAAQLLFLGIVKHYCHANGIDISKEPDIGRGPVDFKVSSGCRLRVLLELKLAKNTRFWDGLTKQLPKYLQAEEIRTGYFVVIAFNDSDMKKVNALRDITAEVARKVGYAITPFVVDARPGKPSASKL
jgi:hypothetical protein